jgi:PAS domain S-box-containing protein
MVLAAVVEEKKQTSDQLFRSIFENAQIGISFYRTATGEIFPNRALQEMLGYSEKELAAWRGGMRFLIQMSAPLARNDMLNWSRGNAKRINRQVATELLDSAGANVTVANHGGEAVRILTEGEQPPPFDMKIGLKSYLTTRFSPRLTALMSLEPSTA